MPLVNGQVTAQGISLGNKWHERYLGTQTFGTTPNEKIDILLPDGNIQGWFEVDVVSGQYASIAVGRLTKRINAISADRSVSGNQGSTYVNADPLISKHFAISDIRTGSAKGRYITVAHREPTTNVALIVIRYFEVGYGFSFSQIALSPIYTDDPTVYPVPEVGHPITWYELPLINGAIQYVTPVKYCKYMGWVVIRGGATFNTLSQLVTGVMPVGYRTKDADYVKFVYNLNITGRDASLRERVVAIKSNGDIVVREISTSGVLASHTYLFDLAYLAEQ